MTARVLSVVPVLLPIALIMGPEPAPAADPEQDTPGRADNPVSRLQVRLAAQSARLTYDPETGHLRSVLAALLVPESSQVLVFSKTSLQRHRISPRTPRAVYFNDDVYIGYCRNGDVLEVAAADPEVGTAFYTVSQKRGAAAIRLQADNCLLCHASSHNRGVPGHVLRSVTPDLDGEPSLTSSGRRVDQTTPFAERWGGWYVTGRHGSMTHRGNVTAGRGGDPDPRAGQNVLDLTGRFRAKEYLSPHSDIVALLVLEHQTGVHNRFARAALDGARHRVEPGRDPSGTVKELGDDLVSYLLFRGEAPLTDAVSGTSPFAREFTRRGPFDSKGRTLREFDLRKRLFKYPCSYLVYSDAFQKLPAGSKEYVMRRMYAVLTGADKSAEFSHLTAADRQAIREILTDTLPDKPAYWK